MNLLQKLIAAAAVAAMLMTTGVACAQAAPLIPVETLFKKPEYRSVTFSPDQKFMAALVAVNSRFNLVVVDLEKRNVNRVTNFDKADVLNYWWATNERLLFNTGDSQQFVRNAGNGGLYAVDRDGRNSRALVQPFGESGRGFRDTEFVARIYDKAGQSSNEEVFATSNDRSADSFDIYRLNINTGRKSLVTFDSPGLVQQWSIDGEGIPRAAVRTDPETGVSQLMYRSAEGQPYRELRRWNEEVKDVVIPIGFRRASKLLTVASNIGRDTMAFFDFDPESNTLGALIFGDDKYDVYSTNFNGGYGGINGSLIYGGVGENDRSGKVIGVQYMADRLKTVWFDEDVKKTQEMLDAALPKGNYNTWNPARTRTLVSSRSDIDPGQFFIFDQKSKTIEDTGLKSARLIDPKQMRPMQYVSWKAADGMQIDGYLTLPATYKPGSPVPFILHPHGGPWARDVWGYNAEVQFLANRGFAVLQPNFRGSVGYGRKFLTASFKQFGDTMIDDQLAGVEWAIKEGYADKNRLAVYGASYGGYSTLMALVKRPDWFKWGVNYVGVSDMDTLHDNDRSIRFAKGADRSWAVSIGDPKTEKVAYERWSPARQVDKIMAPVFHAYGGEDLNVDIANGRVIRAAFDKAGKTQEWMFVANEAHGYRLDANVFEYYNRFDAFMKKYTPAAN